MRHSRSLVLLLTPIVAAGLAACASKRGGGTPDNEPTLKTLAGRQVVIEKDPGVDGSVDKAIAAYRDFLAAAPKATQRSEAMRRLGDLEMDAADNRIASGQANGTVADFKAAITRYQDYLKTYPQDPGNDRVRSAARAGELSRSV